MCIIDVRLLCSCDSPLNVHNPNESVLAINFWMSVTCILFSKIKMYYWLMSLKLMIQRHAAGSVCYSEPHSRFIFWIFILNTVIQLLANLILKSGITGVFSIHVDVNNDGLSTDLISSVDSIKTLQLVQNTVAPVWTRTTVLAFLLWLPVKFRIDNESVSSRTESSLRGSSP